MKHPNSLRKTTLSLCKIVSATALLGALALTAAQAGTDTVDSKSAKDKNVIQPPPPKTPRFYLTLSGGADIDYNATRFLSDGGGHLLGEPAHIDNRYFPHLHDGQTQVGELTAGYIINPMVSVFGRFDYNHSFKTREEIGRVQDTAALFGADTKANIPISADLSDYNSYGGKAGVKLSLPPMSGVDMKWTTYLKPYVTFAAGGTYVEHTNANLAIDAGTPAADYLGDYRLYRSSWVFSTDGRLGIEYDITNNIALNLEGGLGYDSKLERAGHSAGKHASTEQLGLTGVSEGGDRLYSPVMTGIKFSF
jgi:opacity protein-like surface antigen